MLERMKTMRWLLLLSGILWILLGVTTILTPAATLVSLALFISLMMLLSGITEVFAYFADEPVFRSGWLLAGGILSVLLGLWLLIGQGYEALAVMIPFVFAAWVVSAGITRAVGAFSLKAAEYANWGWVLALGILEALLGFLLLYSPLLSLLLTTTLITVLFFSRGISNITVFATLTRARKALKVMDD